ncbi:MAG: hypothetical protein ACT4QA_21005 [Panacagrimonas sp.]
MALKLSELQVKNVKPRIAKYSMAVEWAGDAGEPWRRQVLAAAVPDRGQGLDGGDG